MMQDKESSETAGVCYSVPKKYTQGHDSSVDSTCNNQDTYTEGSTELQQIQKKKDETQTANSGGNGGIITC